MTDNKKDNAVKGLVKAVGDNLDKLSDMDCAKIEGFIAGVACNAGAAEVKKNK